MSTPTPSRRGKKLLVAAIGVATVTYAVACDKAPPITGNLPAPPTSTPDAGPPPQPTEIPPTSGNLPAPPTTPTPPPPPPAAPRDAGAPKPAPVPHKVG